MFDLFVDGKYVTSGHTDYLDLALLDYLKGYRMVQPNKHITIEYIYAHGGIRH
ncbi:hypothetical protein P9Y11_23175 [Bacillus cereus]|nr:hypothetical protein [Bacillus cereus]